MKQSQKGFRRSRGASTARGVAALALASLAACKAGPDYRPPEMPMPASWVGLASNITPDSASKAAQSAAAPSATPGGAASDSASASSSIASQSPSSRTVTGSPDIVHWWSTLNDATLTSLIERVSAANLDLVQARARILEARAALRIAGAALQPSVDASASATRSGPPQHDSYRAGLDAAWEIDLFGGVRRGVEAADADLLSAVETERALRIALFAQVASAYFDLRGAQSQLAIAHENLTEQLKSLDLTRSRHDTGFVSGLDVASADAQVASTRARLPTLEEIVHNDIYALSVLLGQQPTALLDELSPATAIAVVPPQVPVGLPADLLRRRPDIRAAEANLHSATARIGVAESARYPQLTLGGTIGLAGSRVTALSTWADRFYSFGPSLSLPLFQGGRIEANIEAQRAFTDASLAAYEKTVLVALQEVETTLFAYAKEQERGAALTEALRADEVAVDLATQLYAAGRTDFLNVLTAQGQRFSAEDSLAQSHRQVVQNLVALYKALGGGWDEVPLGE